MMLRERESQKEGSTSSSAAEGVFTSLISRVKLWVKLGTSKRARERFVESHLDRSLAYQIRALRGDLTQAEFAKKIGIEHANNVSARLENPQYGKHQIRILKKIAAACDVALVVWFVPFSRMVDWATTTPYVDRGLIPSFYEIPEFKNDALESFDSSVAFGNNSLQPSNVKAEGEKKPVKPEMGRMETFGNVARAI